MTSTYTTGTLGSVEDTVTYSYGNGLNITISKTRSYVDIYISNAKMHIILCKYGGIKLK